MTSDRLNLQACLDRVRTGDEAAATELVAALMPLVRRTVCANLPWRTSPEDLCQEVFIKVFSRLDQYVGVVPFEHWVARVALNTCRDQFRRAARNREVHWTDLAEEESRLLENLPHGGSGESDAAAQTAARDLADRLLETLSPEDRLVITLLDLEHQPASRVREVTGWSITAIRVRAFRARRRLRRALDRLMPGGAA